MISLQWLRAVTFAWSLFAVAALAQPPGPPPAPRSPRAAAQVDVTGNWVAQITEDWRWRMITPPKGDYASVPLNALGRQVADAWDPAADAAADEACRAFGAGGIMRLPTRLKIAWTDESTLRIETDLGQSGARAAFRSRGARGQRAELAGSFRGGVARCAAARESVRRARGADTGGGGRARGSGSGRTTRGRRCACGDRRPTRGSLKVVTTNLRPGYLRKNGVPYSERAVVTEYFDRFAMFGNDYLQVVTVVTDPTYLTTPFVVSNQFKREPDDSKWNPTPCATDAPLGTFQRPAF